ncbi:hypothetical protein LSCM1_05569 [Leishmania martiniquensis]|uniref:DUF306 domain-containing protein n=1 Tax=Leishmania martiniquensis TaxID=1580590 RepID=A0A836KN49_9TRYP|nr:hypothetical protein LSCM1_05569 [Leishmania martiniquensis]
MEARSVLGKYVAKTMDGKPVPQGVMMELRPGESSGAVKLHARVANIMNGQLKVENGKLFGLLISTMMMGSNEQMRVEDALSQGFSEGMKFTLKDGGRLRLQSGSHTIEFVSV